MRVEHCNLTHTVQPCPLVLFSKVALGYSGRYSTTHPPNWLRYTVRGKSNIYNITAFSLVLIVLMSDDSESSFFFPLCASLQEVAPK